MAAVKYHVKREEHFTKKKKKKKCEVLAHQNQF